MAEAKNGIPNTVSTLLWLLLSECTQKDTQDRPVELCGNGNTPNKRSLTTHKEFPN